MLATVFAVLSCTPAQKNADPDLRGFDYRAVHREAMSLVADGKGEKGVELLDGLTVSSATFGDDGRDALRKEFALYFGAGGKHLGSEVVGFKRLTSRIYKFYAIGYWEKKNAVLLYEVAKGADDKWRISTLMLRPKLDELERIAPFVPLGPPSSKATSLGREQRTWLLVHPVAATL